jgi:prefoldin subunit 5
MAATDKDTIYIDIDDEITGIIDKLKSSNGKIVALVLPKRATVFQSIVNMKLLKRAADSSKKHLVLITSEAGLLPLAGLAGVHVAKTLTSKPEVPAGPIMAGDDDEEQVAEDPDADDELPEDAAEQPVGKLAGLGAAGAGAAAADGVETLTLDDDDAPEEELAVPLASKTFTPPKAKKDSKLKVPNFNRFRLMLALVVLIAILLIGGGVYAAVKLPKAVISIKTDATNVDTSLQLNLSTTATTLKASSLTVPAKLASQQKSNTQQVTTTGQKNNGTKASGKVSMTAVVCDAIDSPASIPAGTGVSANGLTFITQSSADFGDLPSGKPSSKCYSFNSNDVSIVAQNGGASYNGSNTFTVAGRKDVTVKVTDSV